MSFMLNDYFAPTISYDQVLDYIKECSKANGEFCRQWDKSRFPSLNCKYSNGICQLIIICNGKNTREACNYCDGNFQKTEKSLEKYLSSTQEK